jgi:hypothetical protein
LTQKIVIDAYHFATWNMGQLCGRTNSTMLLSQRFDPLLCTTFPLLFGIVGVPGQIIGRCVGGCECAKAAAVREAAFMVNVTVATVFTLGCGPPWSEYPEETSLH